MDVTYRIMHAGVDLACDAFTGTTEWGRDSVTEQPPPATSRVVLDDPAGRIARAVTIGASWQIVAVLDGVELPRFTGYVVAVAIDHEQQLTTVTAADELARLGRTIVGDVPWPDELDGARIVRILTAAGVPLSDAGAWADQTGAWADVAPAVTWRSTRAPRVDVGTVTLMGRDVDAQPAARLLADTADDAGGIVYVDRRGRLVYRDADHRVGPERDIPVDACDLAGDGAVWVLDTAGMVNDLRVRYGPTPDGGEQPELRLLDADSVATYGRHAVSRTTQLRDLADADSLARRYMTFRRRPRWDAPALTVDTDQHDQLTPQLAELVAATVSTQLRLSGVPDPVPTGQPWPLIVEGGRDLFDPGRLVVELVASDERYTIRGMAWADVDPVTAWLDVPGDVAWFDADQLTMGAAA